MNEESKPRKNTDYSNSAVNLNNSETVKTQLELYIALRDEADRVRGILEQTDQFKAWLAAGNKANDQKSIVQETIESVGSFQDTEKGMYAIKQRKESIIYKPELARQYLESKALSMVLVESVDTRALDGLVKGGIVKPETARQCGEIKESFAYIIK